LNSKIFSPDSGHHLLHRSSNQICNRLGSTVMVELRPLTTTSDVEFVGILNTTSKISELLRSLSKLISQDFSDSEPELLFVKNSLHQIWIEEWISSRHPVVNAFLKSRIGCRHSSSTDFEGSLSALKSAVTDFLNGDTAEATVHIVRKRGKLHDSPMKVCRKLTPKQYLCLTFL
jgi:hypothetical protein